MANAIGPLLHGAVATLALSLLGTILATIIGVAAAIAAQCGSILSWLITVYVSFIRPTLHHMAAHGAVVFRHVLCIGNRH